MALNLHLPESPSLTPSITVFGVGGAGGNAVNNMITAKLEGVKFVAANTDSQALENSLADHRIQLGENLTKGLGAGSAPEVGCASAEESASNINEFLQNCNMVFITAGMGGGTGTGAAPVIAKLAKDQGILTVGVVTKPFHFEGSKRMQIAELGVNELQSVVDTLIVIPNQNLFRIANEKTTFGDAFKMADDVLHAGVRGITDLITMPGLINLDFADVRSVMSEMGKAMMGTGDAEGESRAVKAAEAAISNPLLDNVSMQGAKGVLINITGGPDMTLFEVDEAANRIREEVDADANIIFGSTFNADMEGRMRISVIATGIDAVTNEDNAQTFAFAHTKAASAQHKASAPNASSPALETNTIQAEPEIRYPAAPQPAIAESFASQPPVEPAHFSSTVQQKQPSNQPDATSTPQVSASQETEEEESQSKTEPAFSRSPAPAVNRTSTGGIGLFSRNRSNAREQASAKGDDVMVMEKEAAEPQSNEATTQEEMLDIPAFLRRKTD